MKSFAAGFLLSVVLSGFTLWAMMAGTVTMVERSDTVSTLTGGVWHADSPASMEAPVDAGM